MRRLNACFFGVLLLASVSFAETATVNIDGGNIESTGSLLTIETALPAGAVGMRISRAVLEVALVLGDSENEVFNVLPVVELYEDGSETPMQSSLLEPDLDGIARFDVTRFVRNWENANSRSFIVGAVSEDNDTVVELGTVASWPNGTKARLIVEYHDRDGASLVQD